VSGVGRGMNVLNGEKLRRSMNRKWQFCRSNFRGECRAFRCKQWSPCVVRSEGEG